MPPGAGGAPLSARSLAALLVLVAALAGCGGGASPATRTQSRPAAAPSTRTAAAAPTPTATTQPSPAPKPKPKPLPGSLPQTSQLPSAATAGFQRQMRALWAGVQRNSVAAAMPAFFPEGAYAQVKAIADPQADFTARLVGDFRLDLGAAHALLGAEPGSAHLVGVQVPQAYAHWVDPGACYNRVGYYEVPNSRVIYRQGGQIRSFGIASMISWRGVWYVVHLGAVVRPSAAGVVDDPSSGPGSSAASSTC